MSKQGREICHRSPSVKAHPPSLNQSRRVGSQFTMWPTLQTDRNLSYSRLTCFSHFSFGEIPMSMKSPNFRIEWSINGASTRRLSPVPALSSERSIEYRCCLILIDTSPQGRTAGSCVASYFSSRSSPFLCVSYFYEKNETQRDSNNSEPTIVPSSNSSNHELIDEIHFTKLLDVYSTNAMQPSNPFCDFALPNRTSSPGQG